MDVSGLQKLTLLDYPGRVACTVFTGGCNLRCPFCHNASLALPERERDVIGHEELMACGVDYEFRTTAVKGLHLPEDFEGIGRWIAGAREYYIQGFKDSGDLIAAQGLSEFSEAEMQRLADIVRPYVPAVKLRGV